VAAEQGVGADKARHPFGLRGLCSSTPVFDGQKGVPVSNGTQRDTLEIRWQGEAVGYVTNVTFETVDMFQSYLKLRGEWVPLAAAHVTEFLEHLAARNTLVARGRMEVTVAALDSKLGSVLGNRSKVFFSLSSDRDAWLVVEELAPSVEPLAPPSRGTTADS